MPYFSEIHAAPATQLGRETCTLEDSPEVAALRGAESFEDLLKLGSALNYQLRYRDALPVYDRAIALCPEDIRGWRQRAPRLINTLQPEKAIADLEHCRAMGGSEEDLSYRLAIAHYLAGHDEASMAESRICLPYCDEEMGIAVIYWHTLAAWRLGQAPVLLYQSYHPGMKVGHHTAYEGAMALAAGMIGRKQAMQELEALDSDLEYAIYGYGVSCWLRQAGHTEEAEALLDSILRRDSFWIGYAFIAAWRDRFGLPEQKS